jgi:hypothetical protein
LPEPAGAGGIIKIHKKSLSELDETFHLQKMIYKNHECIATIGTWL